MHKFLLVDDEKIIREGISQLVNWKEMGIELIQAKDGLEAYDLTEKEYPEVIITDIKMPGMDGLELIEKVSRKYPNIKFVILSGYGEFNYASRAMQMGVKYYLLKPSDENEITTVAKKVMEEIKSERQKEDIVRKIKRSMANILPQVKEQFLRDCIMGRSYKEGKKLDMLKLLNLDIGRIRIALMKFNKEVDFERKFVLKGLCENILRENIIFSTIMEDYVLIMTNPMNFKKLMNRIIRVRQIFYNYYGIYFTTAISEEDDFSNISYLYKEVKKYLEYRFYLSEPSIITRRDILQGTSYDDTDFNYEQISYTVKSGNFTDAKKLIDDFFEKLKLMKLGIDVTKSYCLELYMSILRQAEPGRINYYIDKIIDFHKIDNINQVYDFILIAASEIARNNYEMNIRRHNKIIDSIIRYVDMNISNENLSLSWLAKEIVYMNVDYLGKLFKKNIGKSFSSYLLSLRIEKAKELIRQYPELKVYEIAERVGYGNNPQYFSQVFKKMTRYTPSEYKRVCSK